MLDELKQDLSCSRCPESDPACLDFHHRDPSEKLFEITAGMFSRSRAKVLNEIAKCDVLCANCHRKLHRDERRTVRLNDGETQGVFEWVC